MAQAAGVSEEALEQHGQGWAANPATSPEVLRALWEHKPRWRLDPGYVWTCGRGARAALEAQDRTKRLVLTNPSPPGDIMLRIAFGGIPPLRARVGLNPSFPFSHRELLLRAGSTADLRGLTGLRGLLSDRERRESSSTAARSAACSSSRTRRRLTGCELRCRSRWRRNER
jgi:hypothetical protein